MKVILFKNLNNTGIVIEHPCIIPDYLEFEFVETGTFKMGAKSYTVDSPKIFIPQIDVRLGSHMKLVFIDRNGREYNCGEIFRSGSRFMEFHNDMEHTLVDACAALDEARGEIAELKNEIKKIKEQMGISLIGG
ncbi:MAG: hypothetical protein E7649_06970 [Ruminococcaceae bacterium]|nr:hypothetical protein [Oscillospiraceae bacterium]